MADQTATTRRGLVQGAAALAALGASPALADDLDWSLPARKSVSVNGHAMAYFEAGTGPDLVLVHGMSGSASFEWGRVIGPLSKRFRVLAPYLIGFTPSDQPDLAYDAATFVDYLGGFMDAVGAKSPAIAGESFGGWVVTHYALARGGKAAWGQARPPVSSLVIVDGAVRVKPRPPGTTEPQSVNDPSLGPRIRERFLPDLTADNGKVRTKVMGGSIAREAVQRPALQTLRTPTLLIWGDGDQLIPLEDGKAIAADIPGARLEVIANCGHIPSVERPQAFIDALTGFLA